MTLAISPIVSAMLSSLHQRISDVLGILDQHVAVNIRTKYIAG
jgi:hypothetical protein